MVFTEKTDEVQFISGQLPQRCALKGDIFGDSAVLLRPFLSLRSDKVCYLHFQYRFGQPKDWTALSPERRYLVR